MTKNEIYFILTDKPNIFQDVKVTNKVNVDSDHIIILGKTKKQNHSVRGTKTLQNKIKQYQCG